MVPYHHGDGAVAIPWNRHTKLEVTELPSSTIIKGVWQVEERTMIEANVYDALNGVFGMPNCLYCIQGRPQDESSWSRSWSNTAWLPSKKDIPKYFWKVGSTTQPEDMEPQYLVLTVLATEGEKYTEVSQAKDLVESLVHSALGASSFSRCKFAPCLL